LAAPGVSVGTERRSPGRLHVPAGDGRQGGLSAQQLNLGEGRRGCYKLDRLRDFAACSTVRARQLAGAEELEVGDSGLP